MPLFFLVPVLTACITGYFFNKKNLEIAYIAGILTAVTLVVSLFLASWQLQLVLLAVIIFLSNQLLAKINTNDR
ncbi:hypothetical protein CEP10_01525 [Cylindrospermopsis raciborskii S07]|jgi:membrane protein YdbS with pleckstrin-like domain|uniref:Uncharacterized protein n=2 Tax=Cylindrospermopsis raciborskii TaxID=77022 RepID=A0A853MBG7_9CYAN|nr:MULTISPECIES: hypothetical protein [Cylindrospermopsis]MBU6345619.1 hypothetical protein [Cyanobacteria bacterium REEB494]EFA69269.1 conserved hypothetical protein [Cylindrospermopsis raciborskii CS-505]KRH98423.1 hypothetical protein ASL19_00190 [Cylindrospermopsis sp. CR12]MBA4450478.1 hypothetical protein [Cylindrospermopsis raciborskii CS-506_D]MCH4905409.1 hypothetical protein [Cylindrospermopsis raciborskii CHAB3438]